MKLFHIPSFSADTFTTHANLHRYRLLALPIIIPESDLNHPVIDIELDPDFSHVEPGIPVSLRCSLMQQIQPQIQPQSICSESVEEDDNNKECEDEADDTDVVDGDESQSEKSLFLFPFSFQFNFDLCFDFTELQMKMMYNFQFVDVWYNVEVSLLLELI